MAEAHTVNKPMVILPLTLHEAVYLKSLVYKALTGSGEADEDRKVREGIWIALSSAGIHTPHDAIYRQVAQNLIELMETNK